MIPHPVRATRDRAAREILARKPSLAWWLVYGPVRSGTTHMMRIVAAHARIYIGDWGLRFPLQLPPDAPHIAFDRARARRDVARNVIRNAHAGSGSVIDLLVKSAQLRGEEHTALMEMWGPPRRTIFCVREPSGYLASAVRKFPGVPVDAFRAEYVRDIAAFRSIGGDLFVYRPDLTLDDYRSFLAPLVVTDEPRFQFVYSGSAADDLVTDEMREAFASLALDAPRSERPGD